MHFMCSKATQEQHSQIARLITQMVPGYNATPLPALGGSMSRSTGTNLDGLCMAKASKVVPLPASACSNNRIVTDIEFAAMATQSDSNGGNEDDAVGVGAMDDKNDRRPAEAYPAPCTPANAYVETIGGDDLRLEESVAVQNLAS